MMGSTLEKVTVFITWGEPGDEALLLFRHPYAGIQIPAGTVEVGETPAAAALREAREESGLRDLVVERYLGTATEALTGNEARVVAPTPVYARADVDSFAWAHLPRGAAVRLLGRFAAAFCHVTYEEPDRYPDPSYVTMAITGWVPDAALTRHVQRSFFHLRCDVAAATSWPVRTDNHTFTAFWAPLDDLPAIVPPQDRWLSWLRPVTP